jgi:RND family efflux transporter MFP subunit
MPTLAFAAFGVGVVLLMLWLIGAFRAKIGAEPGEAAGVNRPIGTAQVVDVASRTIPLEETAVGTIEPVHRVELASRLLARAIEVNVVAGQHVAKGDVLVRLDDADLVARKAQAEAAVAQAQAELNQARIQEERDRASFEQNAVTQIEMDRATNALRAAEANVTRLQQAQNEAETILEYATIRSPIDGIVIDKRVNSGDTVSPGEVVVTLLDPTRMQLVASVPESLSRRLNVGDSVTVNVESLGHACQGTVSEIVPEAESASRTFEVKVTGPCPEGVYAGMFGRLSIPIGQETVLLIPTRAVHTVGQLTLVDVGVDAQRQRRAIRVGRVMDDEVEVLAGLAPGERVVVDAEHAPHEGEH